MTSIASLLANLKFIDHQRLSDDEKMRRLLAGATPVDFYHCKPKDRRTVVCYALQWGGRSLEAEIDAIGGYESGFIREWAEQGWSQDIAQVKSWEQHEPEMVTTTLRALHVLCDEKTVDELKTQIRDYKPWDSDGPRLKPPVRPVITIIGDISEMDLSIRHAINDLGEPG